MMKGEDRQILVSRLFLQLQTGGGRQYWSYPHLWWRDHTRPHHNNYSSHNNNNCWSHNNSWSHNNCWCYNDCWPYNNSCNYSRYNRVGMSKFTVVGCK